MTVSDAVQYVLDGQVNGYRILPGILYRESACLRHSEAYGGETFATVRY